MRERLSLLTTIAPMTNPIKIISTYMGMYRRTQRLRPFSADLLQQLHTEQIPTTKLATPSPPATSMKVNVPWSPVPAGG